MPGYLDVMTMKLITHCGRRLDRQMDLATMIRRAKTVPYLLLSGQDREQIRLLLHLEHQERERARYRR